MAQKITVQDGKVVYTSSDPANVSMDFSVLGVIKAGNNNNEDALITTPPGTNINLLLTTHTVAGVPGLTVIVTGALVAVVGEAHVAFDVSITVTKAPFVSEVVLNDELFVPAFTPFTCH